MDAIYQAIKNVLKSFVNLFVAIVELFAGLINGLASILLKLRPRTDRGSNKESADKAVVDNVENADEELVCRIRNELKQQITDRDTYILIKAETEVFESSHMKKAFAGHKKKLANAVTRILLEEEFNSIFFKEETAEDMAEAGKAEVMEQI